MSETPIQRWLIQNPPGQPTEFVSVTDHEAAVRAAVEVERAKWEVLASDVEYNAAEIGYEQGQRDERDRIRKGVKALVEPHHTFRFALRQRSKFLAVIDAAPPSANERLIDSMLYSDPQDQKGESND